MSENAFRHTQGRTTAIKKASASAISAGTKACYTIFCGTTRLDDLIIHSVHVLPYMVP